VNYADSARPAKWKRAWNLSWTELVAALFFLDVLPYREDVYQAYHRDRAATWLGSQRAEAITREFAEVARQIGYGHEQQTRLRGAATLLGVLMAAGKTDIAELTQTDFVAWEQCGVRSPRIPTAGVMMARRVVMAMGLLPSEAAGLFGGHAGERFTWGHTAPAIADAFERFLADWKTTRRPGTMETYTRALRRFGDWLGQYDDAVTSLSEVHRRHIEAYKQAVNTMRTGDYLPPALAKQAGRRLGCALSRSCQVRSLSCVKTCLEMIEMLEYPDRPGRALFVRGDVRRVDDEAPRFIPDADWHRLVSAADRLTPELVRELGLRMPYEQIRAILGVLLECGLRAGELCRLETGCIITAEGGATRSVTHWLHVPVGKLRQDRLIPIRPNLVQLIDEWMRRRGPQPLLWDERTNSLRDHLFAWQGGRLSPAGLNRLITRLCFVAAVPRFTSHTFRHTLAVQWRKNGMRIETISSMLGHRDLKMTLRYAAVMPMTVRREFDQAFAAIDDEHRVTAQMRVVLSPEAHLAAARAWRESLWVDLGIGWCGLSAFLPCENRLACLPCVNFIEKREQLPLLQEQRSNLIELRMLGDEVLPADRQEEIKSAVQALDDRIEGRGVTGHRQRMSAG
jgi:integrase